MYEIISGLLALAGLICLLRVATAKTAPDRVLATDALVSLVAAGIVMMAVVYGNEMFIDVALVYAMLAFISTLAISKYLEGKRIWE